MFTDSTTVKTYKGKLTLLGEMSQVPDSQKLFGAIVYLLSDVIGSDAATEFVRNAKEESIIFTLSSILPEGYLPTPKEYLLRIAQTRADAAGNEKTIYSNVKKMDYLRCNQITELLIAPEKLYSGGFSMTSLDFVHLDTNQQVHVNTLNEDGDENHIFSTQQTSCTHKENTIKAFEFFINTNDSLIPELLEKQLNHIFTLGKRSSQGYNLFKLTSFGKIEAIAPSSRGPNLNLGMLLPNQIDYCAEQSALALFSSERRPYTKNRGAWDSSQANGHFISFLAPGSVIVLSDAKQPYKAGKSVVAPTASNGEIVYGNAFLYPLEVKE